MKDFKQLQEDIRTNEELAKKIEEAERKMRRTGSKEGFRKAVAELGYDLEEQFTSSGEDDLVKLDEEELDDVAGGRIDDENGIEIGCWFYYLVQRNDLPVICPKSPSRIHCMIETAERIPCQGTSNGKAKYVCKYCNGWTFEAY
jgi:hypothetical protein